jgi:hypothetical protein
MWYVVLIRGQIWKPCGSFRTEYEAAVWATQQSCDNYIVRRRR